MASTVKVAIAHRLLERVDRGELALDTMVPFEAGDRHPGSGTLAELFDEPGVSLSLRNYLELMLLISDNSATDLLLRQAGGAEAVTASLEALGIEGQRVDRSTLRLIADFVGVTSVPENEALPLERYVELARGLESEERARRGERFDLDPRDTSTPEAMERLLAAIWEGKALKPASRDLLIDIMRRCETGQARLKGLLPPGTSVAHKTGSIGRTTNDVGIINLPDGAGHVIAVAFVKESRVDTPARERVIADAARAIHDFFLFSPQ
jgi:beta-lactamase class A